ncbi:DUF4493 domain-containing protein [Flammeovirga sp. SJP92]|uniref:DUF4493 domain-containing protein n=1 Tax=Flammeovirga sp. SJP92 TaxID=1775430 RepID=UPI000786F4DE|nr:DUF4493 domain-containing protein [Flammeovirga sp. SJP92]KXX66767.1 hypothetical protein AVL50_30000 [Flammeovirga sp. SJP92]
MNSGLKTILVSIIILFTACENIFQSQQHFGDVSFQIEVTEPDLYTSDLSITNTDLFAIRIENVVDRSEVITFSHLHDIPSTLKLKQGQYDVFAYSSPSEESDELIFKGKKRLTVIEGNATLLNIQCIQGIDQE